MRSTRIAVLFLVDFGNDGDANGRLSNIFSLYNQELRTFLEMLEHTGLQD
jgi:hypothetical protein